MVGSVGVESGVLRMEPSLFVTREGYKPSQCNNKLVVGQIGAF